MHIVAIIQARMTSTRLPGKVMMPVGDKLLIELMLERVKKSKYINQIVVAMPKDDKCDELEVLCQKMGIGTFKGEEHDVLSRFVGAAKAYNAEIVMRLCSDCPLIDPALIDAVIEKFLDTKCDYLNNVKMRSFPDGLDAEIFTMEALLKADAEAKDPKHREHVTTYIDGRVAGLNHGSFICGSLDNDVSYGHLMWSVNTQEQLDHIRELYANLDDKENFNWKDVLKAEEKINGTQKI